MDKDIGRISGNYKANFTVICQDLNILGHGICPYLDILTDIPNLAATCRFLDEAIYSLDLSTIWNSVPVDICVDGCCVYGCGRRRLGLGSGWALIRKAPIHFLRLHLPFDKLDVLMRCLLKKGTIRRLHLRFRFDQSSKLRIPISSIPSSTMKCSLTHLTVFGWPTIESLNGQRSHRLVKTCNQFLSLIGASLVSLHFHESSPSYIIDSVAKFCPLLSSLTIEGSHVHYHNLLQLQSAKLHDLCLRNSNIKLDGLLNFPYLQRLEYSNPIDQLKSQSQSDLEKIVGAIPDQIKELSIKVNSKLANPLIRFLGDKLHNLDTLQIHLPDLDYELPMDINNDSIISLSRGCSNLLSLEIKDGLICFTNEAIQSLGYFQKLQRLTMIYNDNILDCLPQLLSQTKSLEQITLLENADDLYTESGGPERWNEIEESLRNLKVEFPHVDLVIQDCWWV